MTADANDYDQTGRTLRDSATVVSAKRRLEPLLEAVAADPFNARARMRLRAFLGTPLTAASSAWTRLQAQQSAVGVRSAAGRADVPRDGGTTTEVAALVVVPDGRLA